MIVLGERGVGAAARWSYVVAPRDARGRELLRVPGQGALGSRFSQEGREEEELQVGLEVIIVSVLLRGLVNLRLRRLRDQAQGDDPADALDGEHGAEGRHRALVFHGRVVLLVRPVRLHERVHRQEDLDRPDVARHAQGAERLGESGLTTVSYTHLTLPTIYSV